MQVGHRKDRDEIVLEGVPWQVVQKKRGKTQTGLKSAMTWEDSSSAWDAESSASMHKIPGKYWGFRLMGKEFSEKLWKWGSRHNGEHDLQCIVGTNGKMSQFFFRREEKGKDVGENSTIGRTASGGKDWETEGKKLRVTRTEFQSLQESFHGANKECDMSWS